jgi:cytochrome c553
VRTKSRKAIVASGPRCVVLLLLGVFGLTVIAASLPAYQNSGRPDIQRPYQELRNPYSGQRQAAKQGRKLFVEKCARCHGRKAEGTASVPALAGETTQSVPEGVGEVTAVVLSYTPLTSGVRGRDIS